MPKLLEETVVEFELADLAARRPLKRPAVQPERSPGVHVSGILKYCATAAGILKPGEELEELLPLRMAVGMAWEEFAVSMYTGLEWQPGERVVDGIAMNADGLYQGVRMKPRTPGMSRIAMKGIKNVAANSMPNRLAEFKATWKSSHGRRMLKFLDEWMWMQQGKAYCHGYGTNRVEWHVLYVNGDYRQSGPQYVRYLVEFSDEEVRQTWRMLLANKDKARPE